MNNFFTIINNIKLPPTDIIIPVELTDTTDILLFGVIFFVPLTFLGMGIAQSIIDWKHYSDVKKNIYEINKNLNNLL